MVDSSAPAADNPLATVANAGHTETGESSAPTSSNKRHYHPFTFHGNALEFFKIWIVNVLLTVVTLGIYSAGAKVRTMRYFYGHTGWV